MRIKFHLPLNDPKLKIILPLFLLLFIGILINTVFKSYAKSVKDEHSITTRISSRIFDFNTFDLQVDSKLNLNDFVIIHKNSGNTIYSNGNYKEGITNNYGHRTFELYQNGIKMFQFGHFSTNNWYTFDYSLSLESSKDFLEPSLEINGALDIYSDFYYKRFEYNSIGELERISFLNLDNEVYHIEE